MMLTRFNDGARAPLQAREVDQDTVSRRLATEIVGGDDAGDGAAEMAAQMAAGIKARMSGRGFAVGSNPITAPIIEEDFKAALVTLEAHLAPPRAFLLGGVSTVVPTCVRSVALRCDSGV